MTGKIFRSCFLVGLAVMILCTGLFVAVMASQYEEEVYQQLQEELAYVKHGMEESGQAYLTGGPYRLCGKIYVDMNTRMWEHQ